MTDSATSPRALRLGEPARQSGQEAVWKTWHQPDGLWTVLQHPSGAKAYFSSIQIGDVMLRYGGPYGGCPVNPFQQLVWLIERGLRPSKVEGDTSVFAVMPTIALEDMR